MNLQRAASNPLALVCVLAAALLGGCAPGSTDPGDESFPEAAFATIESEMGGLFIEVRTAPEQPPVRGQTNVELLIVDAEGVPRDDLTVSVVPWMPDMGHGASTKPTSTATGDGHYEVSDVSMFMPGRWELRTKISGSLDESAKVVFQIP